MFAAGLVILAASLAADVPTDDIPRSLSLPSDYPDSWVFVHDVNYPAAVLGKFLIIDVAAPSNQHKGQFQGAQLAGFVESARRNEWYVAETHYSRTGHGERLDTLTIYEPENLSVIGEVVLPGQKRALMMPHKGQVQLTRDERFALVFNFTPAASVTVVDLERREVAAEVPVPGCTLIYPTGETGFSTLCANGSLATFTLDAQGKLTGEAVSEAFNDIDEDPMYMTPAWIGASAHFVTEHGQLRAIDLEASSPAIGQAWALLSPAEANEGWRPAGGPSLGADDRGRLYVTMRKTHPDGSAVAGTSEIWLYDPAQKQRIASFPLVNDTESIEVTHGDSPFLVAIVEGGIDVYALPEGRFARHIGGYWPLTAMHVLVHASQ